MGYDVHITRRSDWTDHEGPEITEAEWKTLAQADPELEVGGQVQMQMDDGTVRGIDLYGWKAHPAKQFPPFMWYRGEIVVKNPDESTLAKMQEIARELGANVQGDEGEHYDDPVTPTTGRSDVVVTQQRTSWWKRLFGGN